MRLFHACVCVCVVPGKINFCDLAGSEKVYQTKSSGQTLVETRNINRSLHVLAKVRPGRGRTQRGRSLIAPDVRSAVGHLVAVVRAQDAGQAPRAVSRL